MKKKNPDDTRKLAEKLCPTCQSEKAWLFRNKYTHELRWEKGTQGGDHLEENYSS
jgi:hypothetical protein